LEQKTQNQFGTKNAINKFKNQCRVGNVFLLPTINLNQFATTIKFVLHSIGKCYIYYSSKNEWWAAKTRYPPYED